MSDSSYDFAPEPKEPGEGEVPKKKPEVVAAPVVERICPHCGFKVVGKTAKGRCPDCAAPLDYIPTDMLQFSDSGWVAGLGTAAMVIAGAMVVHVVAIVMGFKGMYVIGEAVHVGAALLGAYGVWRVTMPEEGERGVMARVALAAAGATVVLFVAGLAFLLLKNAEATRWMTVLTMLVMGAEAMALGYFLSGLAGRVPNDSLASQFQNLSWLMPGVFLVLLVYQAANLWAYFMFIFFCSFPIAGGLLGILIWAGVSLVKLGMDLGNVTVAAEALLAKRAAREAKGRR